MVPAGGGVEAVEGRLLDDQHDDQGASDRPGVLPDPGAADEEERGDPEQAGHVDQVVRATDGDPPGVRVEKGVHASGG